jgi:hypothetical protein
MLRKSIILFPSDSFFNGVPWCGLKVYAKIQLPKGTHLPHSGNYINNYSFKTTFYYLISFMVVILTVLPLIQVVIAPSCFSYSNITLLPSTGAKSLNDTKFKGCSLVPSSSIIIQPQPSRVRLFCNVPKTELGGAIGGGKSGLYVSATGGGGRAASLFFLWQALKVKTVVANTNAKTMCI